MDTESETAEAKQARKEARRLQKKKDKKERKRQRAEEDATAENTDLTPVQQPTALEGQGSPTSAQSPESKEERKKRKKAKKNHELNHESPTTPTAVTTAIGAGSPSRATTCIPSASQATIASPSAGSPPFPPAPPFFPTRQMISSSRIPNADDFPPGFDFSALQAYSDSMGGGGSSSAAAAGPSSGGHADLFSQLDRQGPPVHERKRTAPSLAALDAAVRSSASGRAGSSSARAVSSRTKNGEAIYKSKELTIADVAGLSEKEILSQKLYQPHQIKWLEEAGLLTTVHRGAFSKGEAATLKARYEEFCTKHKLSEEEGLAILLDERTPEQAELWTQLTTELSAALEGRTNRSVRRWMKESFHPGAGKGAWTIGEQDALAEAFAELGTRWSDISKRVGRTARDCRIRWRDYGSKTGPSKAGRWKNEEVEQLKAAVAEQCEKLNLAPDDPALPWSVISSKVGNRAGFMCLKKWDQLQSKEKRGLASSAVRDVEHMYTSPRDDKTVVEALLQQEKALSRDSEEAIVWKDLATDAFPFARETLLQGWTRLKKKRLPESHKNASLRAKLEILLPIVVERRRRWDSGDLKARGVERGSVWSPERRESLAESQVDQMAQGSHKKKSKKAKTTEAGAQEQDTPNKKSKKAEADGQEDASPKKKRRKKSKEVQEDDRISDGEDEL